MNWYEFLGYAASVLVAVSLMMKNIRYLRQVNFLGSTAFAVYGIIVKAYPVFAVNAFIAMVNIYYLYDMSRRKDQFQLMPISGGDDNYLNEFLNYYGKDISNYFPKFEKTKIGSANYFFILRNVVPVGLFIYRNITSSEIEILLDYAIPDYRDMKNAEFVYYAEAEHFKIENIKTLFTHSSVKTHQKYLLNIGFEQDKTDNSIFRKKV